ncbi:LysR substrate-binding domain-containing protein, partial [Variovorax sp. Varisp62]|uniref:LysR substrate-binding domain-containing protein n=1 Tax=Variovorax sp. Varisp62 TaxID=3243049 RepID=UPI0039B4DC2D
DVLVHDCICIRENDEDVTLWHMRPAKGAAGSSGKRLAARETLRISPAYVTNDGGVARQWAEQGMGLVLRSEWDAADAVARGTLVRVLADWQFDSAPVTLLVPSRKGRTARVQAVVGFLVESFGAAGKQLGAYR